MRRRSVFVVLVALLIITLAGCAGDDDSLTSTSTPIASIASIASTVSSSTSTSSTTTTTTTIATTTTTVATTIIDPDCSTTEVLAVVDARIEAAHLPIGELWTTDTSGSAFAERSVDGTEMARHLGLDCGETAVQTIDAGERFVIVAWTDARLGFVVLADDQPLTPFAADSLVTIITEDLEGEFIGDGQELYGAQTSSGATILIGHDDYNLGATAKSWQIAVPPPTDAETTVDAERYAIDALRAAGARNVSVAQPPENRSEEGYLQYISPRGQIGVADVAPKGAFDPMSPRYLGGRTAVETIAGVDVRVTEPGPEEPSWVRGAEIGFECGDWSWILEPPANGSVDEMVEFASVVVTENC